MKKQYLYLLLLMFFGVTVSFVVIKYKKIQQEDTAATYKLLPRQGAAANSVEWTAAKNNTDNLLAKLTANPRDHKAALALANAYILEARITGNAAYYDKAALNTVENILATDHQHHEALMLKSLLQLSQHHFAEGLETAQLAEKINANNAFVYGLLVDANIEMGNYEAAVDAADKMVSARPDLRSYSRIAYIREIHGDYNGAINAMQLAVQAGVPAEEATEWCRSQLGKLYELTGNAENARLQYQLSLAARPGYAHALAGMGRIASTQKKYDSAVYYFEQAALIISDLGIKQNLAQVYLYAGQPKKATALNNEVIREMKKNTNNISDDPSAGHYSDKEIAYAYLQQNDMDKALEHALAEYNRRPKNIEVNETMAWVYYKRNEFAKALPYATASLVTNARNPILLCTAGLINAEAGNKTQAKLMLQAALQLQPAIPEEIKTKSVQALQKL